MNYPNGMYSGSQLCSWHSMCGDVVSSIKANSNINSILLQQTHTHIGTYVAKLVVVGVQVPLLQLLLRMLF